MRALVGIHRVDDGHVMHLLGQLGKVLTDLHALGGRRDRLNGTLRFGAWFRVERVEVAHATRQIDIDDRFGFSTDFETRSK